MQICRTIIYTENLNRHSDWEDILNESVRKSKPYITNTYYWKEKMEL